MTRFLNVARHALSPRYAPVMARKALDRVRGSARGRAAAQAWARPLAQPIPAWCAARDPALWEEAQSVGRDLRDRARELGERLGVEIGGGARVELLYFLARLVRPVAVVETGVLHGFSSAALLHALDHNGDGGRLWSSDFPYFREAEPERLIGVLVPEELRDRWTLMLDGDRANLPRILAEVEAVDFFHYDSDKSVDGRRFALDLVVPRLAPGAPVVMDDIQDNFFYRDWTAGRPGPHHVLGAGYYVGVTGVA